MSTCLQLGTEISMSLELARAVDAVPGALLEGDDALDFLGPVQPNTIMQQVAEGTQGPTHCRNSEGLVMHTRLTTPDC